ncbi:MAG: hypothetical protein ACI9YH_005170 [Colwellia sp.]|jgi:hypothetical protein
MHVRVTEVNFSNSLPWLFKFSDSSNIEYLAFDSGFYIEHNLSNPVNRMHLDQLDVGNSSKIKFTVINGKNVVTSIK